MSLTAHDLAALAAEANLAPNVHNTQPTRWRLEAASLRLLGLAGDRSDG